MVKYLTNNSKNLNVELPTNSINLSQDMSANNVRPINVVDNIEINVPIG